MGRWRWLESLTVAWVLVLASAPNARPAAQPRQAVSEYQAKAAFLLSFARFAEWPTARLPAGAPLVFGVVGVDPFGPLLDEALATQTIDGHRLQIRRFARVDDIDVLPHVLFVATSEAPRFRRLLTRLQGAGVLSVGEWRGFAPRGGVIGLAMEGKYIRFEVNLASAEGTGVRLSAQLLRLARIVAHPPGSRK